MHYRLVVAGNFVPCEEIFPKRNKKLRQRIKNLKVALGPNFRRAVRLERYTKRGKCTRVNL